MPTASSARLLAAGVAGGNDSKAFKPSSIFDKHSSSSSSSRLGSHAQLNSAAKSVQHAAESAGSLSSSVLKSKTWGGASAAPAAPTSMGGATDHKGTGGIGGRLGSGGFLIPTKVTTTPLPFDSIASSNSTNSSSAKGNQGQSASLLRGSHAATFDDAVHSLTRSHSSSNSSRLLGTSGPSYTATAAAAAGSSRSSSTGRTARLSGTCSPSRQPAGATGVAGRGASPGRPALRTLISTADGSGQVAVPGRPRVLMGGSTAVDDARAAAGSSSKGLQEGGQRACSGPLHSSRIDAKAAAAAVLRTAPGESSSSVHRSASLDTVGLLGSSRRPGQQPQLFEDLPARTSHHSPRPPDAAARPKASPSSIAAAAHTSRIGASLAYPGGSGPYAGGSSYLARLHKQRAATADAISSSLSGSSLDSSAAAGTAGRRVSSASAASSLSSSRSSSASSEQQALGILKPQVYRRPRAVSSDALAASGSAGAAAAMTAGAATSGLSSRVSPGVKCSSGTDAQTLQPPVAAALPDRRLSITSSSSSHGAQGRQQGGQAVGQHADARAQQPEQSAQAVLAALLEKCNKQKLQNLAAATSSRAAADTACGPGEQLAFPGLQQQQQQPQPQQQQPPISGTGSYLDIIRRTSSGSNADRQHGQPQLQQEPPGQQQQPHQQQPTQHQPAGPSAQRPQQYHARLYQPQQYNPALFQQQQQSELDGLNCDSNVPAAGTPATSKSSSNNSSRRSSAELDRTGTVQYRPLAAGLAAVASGSTAGGPGGVYRPPYAPPPHPAPAAGSQSQGSSSSQAPAVRHGSIAGASDAVIARLHSTGSSYYTASSDAGDGEYARSSSSGGGAAVWHDQQVQQQQQQRTRLQQQSQELQQQLPAAALQQEQPHQPHAALHDMHSGRGSSLQRQQQDGELISTQPMPGQGCESDSGALDVCSPKHDQVAAAAAREAFLTMPLSSAGSDDLTAAAAAVDGKAGTSSSMEHHRGGSMRAVMGVPDSSSAGVAAAAGLLGRAAGQNSQPQPRRRVEVVVERDVDAHDTSDSETDASEMSSSLDGNGSDSDGSVDIVVHSHTREAGAAAAGAVQCPDAALGSIAAQQAHHPGPVESWAAGEPQRSTEVRRSRFAGSPASTPVSSGAAAAAAQSPVVQQQCRSLAHRPHGLPRGCCGIRNQGNTCYQNSGVQLLGCVPELVGALLGPQAAPLLQAAAADAANNRIKASVQQALAAAAQAAQAGIMWRPKAVVGPALQALLCEMWGFQQEQQQQLLRRVTDCMAALREAMAETDPRWDDGDQWDCQEFCLALLQTVHNESNRVRGKPQYRELKLQGSEAQQAAEAAAYARSWEDSIVLDIFSWQLQSTMTCCSCGRRSHAFDSSQELLVSIPQGSVDVTVQECLARTIFSPEQMAGAEGYKCDHCKGLREATKQLQLFSYPQVLLLGLKRFETRGGSKGGHTGSETYSSSKVSTRVRVNAQEVLDLSSFCNPAGLSAAAAAGRPPPKYELIAVADHTGVINGGHYTARGRCVLDGSWAEFNDSLVLSADPPSRSSSAAYMMLYRLLGQ